MDWIQGERFIELSSDKIVFCRTEDVNNFFINCDKNKKFILISHCGDGYVTDNPRDVNTMNSKHHADISLIPDNCVKWFASMVEFENYKEKRIVPIPIGVENNYHFLQNSKRDLLLNKISREVNKYEDKLVFVNFKISNNYEERISAYNAIKDTDFCTLTDCMFTIDQLNKPKEPFPHIDKLDYSEFINEMHKHHFVLCPVGNGLDSHRMWEALYIGCIPIVRRIPNYEPYEGNLPILFVDNWSDINKELLLKELAEIKSKTYNIDMLKFSYWENLINEESKKI